MGLDQYLYAKKYTSALFSNSDFEKMKSLLGDDEKYLYADSPSISVMIKVGYWRKSNQIHKWFVDVCQNGEDDCRPCYVSREQLKNLKETCEQVLADQSRAEELLPVQDGFFFGSQEIDEWYLSNISETVKIINRCLEMGDDWEFEYQSSW